MKKIDDRGLALQAAIRAVFDLGADTYLIDGQTIDMIKVLEVLGEMYAGGKWIMHKSGMYMCDRCRYLYPWTYNFCPQCGSRNTREETKDDQKGI